MKKKSFVSSAIILMIASLIVRILGFVYRVYLSNLIGAEGMGLFQLISPVYSLVILTLTSGISIAVSRMVAEQAAQMNYINSRRITFYALIITCISGILVSLLLLFNIDFVVNSILKDSRTYYSMLLLLPNIPIIAASSALKGYFYGMQDVIPNATSQIVEQVVRISVVMFIASRFINLGIEYACAIAVIGMVLGEVSTLLVLGIIYYLKRKETRRMKSRKGTMRKRIILRELLKISFPVSSNRFITSIMSTFEYIMIPRMLVLSGMAYQESMEVYGRLTGMAMPLLFFPSIVTSSLATTLVPAITEAISMKNMHRVNHRITQSLQITFVLGFIFTGIFMAYPNEIGDMIYSRDSIGSLLYALSFTCIFIYLQQILTGTLNGLGKQGVALRNSFIGNIIRIGFVFQLVPKYGIQSYIWGLVTSYAFLTIMNIYAVVKTTHLTLDLRNWILKPGFIGAIMLFVSKYILSFYDIFKMGETLTILCTLATNISIGLFLTVSLGVLSIGDIKKMIGKK